MTNKSKKIILLTFLISGFLFAGQANAAVWGVALVLLAPLLIWIIQLGVFLFVIKVVAGIAGYLINQGILLQNFFLKLEIINVIWTILRDFVNIFFILILLVIAFATIFNIKNYKASELLPKLIIAALLINFSLMITVWVVDLLWVPAQVFLNPLSETVAGGAVIPKVSENISQALSVGKFYEPNFLTRIAGFFQGLATVGLGQNPSESNEAGVFRAILLFIEAFIFSWIALIIWARIPILIGLMIVSPVAWLGFTLPYIRKKTWDEWWAKLFCWAAVPIPLFALIYFVLLFNSKLSLEASKISAALSDPWFLKTVAEFSGLNTGEFIVWLLTIGVFLAGLMYVRDLPCSMYSWVTAGFKKTWKGIGRGADWAYTATGVAGAAKAAKGRLMEEGIPIAGKKWFGAEAKKTREGRIEDRLARWAGLKPTYPTQRITEEQSEKAKRDIENELKQARSIAEENVIIEKLRTAVKEGAKKGATDPETLAAVKVLAKKGQLDVDLFNKAVENFKDMPLTLTGVFNEWKEGKFGGINLEQFVDTMRDKDNKLNLDSRRIMYGFAASDDGKKVAEKMKAEDFNVGAQILGRNTKGGRDYFKFWGDFSPTYVAKYRFDNISEESREYQDKVKTLQDAIRVQMEKASVKDFANYFNKEFIDKEEKIDGIARSERFEGALAAILREKDNRGTAEQFVSELRRRLRREGKDDQLAVVNGVLKDISLEIKEHYVPPTEPE